jgi:hypothetical protein
MTYAPRRALVVNGVSPVTVAVSAEVQAAIEQWQRAHIEDLIRNLKPYGIHPDDIAAPQYRRVVTIDD